MSQQKGICDHRAADSTLQQERVSSPRQIRMAVGGVKAELSPSIRIKAAPLSFAFRMTSKLRSSQRHILYISALIIKATISLRIGLVVLIAATFHLVAQMLFFERKELTRLN